MQIEYTGDLRCQVVHGPSGTKLITDAPVDNQGKGESFSPTDLFATSLATCMATIMGIQARALKIDITGMRVQVTKEMSTDRPRRITKMAVTFDVPCNPGDREKAALIKAAETCPVHHSLHPDLEQTTVFNWGA